MGEVTPMGTNRLPNSSVVQKEVGIGSPNITGATSAENVIAIGKVGPGANTGTRAPECLNTRGSDNVLRTLWH